MREKQEDFARKLLSDLVAEFPDNPLFAAELARLQRQGAAHAGGSTSIQNSFVSVIRDIDEKQRGAVLESVTKGGPDGVADLTWSRDSGYSGYFSKAGFRARMMTL